ncbi:MAG: helix-turn-helix transcriptional regulator [Flavobacteriales bacterium]|nr:helix-turn-helix transcriptional regulator [Flavobacteriales bacterium]
MREFRGIKQNDMARRLNMEPSAYNRLETGETKLDLERAKELGRELDVPPDYFTNDDPVVVHVEHISGGANGYQPRVEYPAELLERLLDHNEARHAAHVKELLEALARSEQMNQQTQELNRRLLDLLEQRLPPLHQPERP